MARTNAQKKGDALEDAVKLIEEVILRSDPATKEATINIETRKKVSIDGVRQEIDVIVTIEGGKYKSIFIFECKNWKDTVGKNEIILFSDKIKEMQAQTGYFIAKRYAKDAVNQAKKDKRIELLKATDNLEILPFLANFHQIHNNILNINISLGILTNDPQSTERLTFSDESKIKLGNEELSLKALTERVQSDVIDEVMNHEPTGTFSAGVYPYDKTKKYIFGPGELIVDGHEISELNAHISWETYVIRPRIISTFDIETRGRIITYEPGELPIGGTIQISFIQIK